jgi:hypothetical protein
MESILTPAFSSFIKKNNRTPLIPKEDKALVQETLKKVYPDVQKFYPIYSDTPDGWQADLTFIWDRAEHYTDLPKPSTSTKRKRKTPLVQRLKLAILCVININTRFAFAEVTEFTPREVETSEETRQKWEVMQKATAEVIKGSNKTAEKARNAFKRILTDMKNLKGQHLLSESGYKGTAKELKGISFKVKTLYTDEGSEFKGAFAAFCKQQKIHLVTFTPSTGTKRRLGIVERFNRTLKGLFQQQWALEDKRKVPRSSIQEMLPSVMKAYNYTNSHRGLVQVVRKNDKVPRKKWSDARFMTPFNASKPGIEQKFVVHKEKERKETDEYYKEDIQKLHRRPYVRFFKNLDSSDFKKFEDKFQRQGQGTLTDRPYRVKGKYKYTSARVPKSGDSFALDGLNGFRVLPYDVVYPSTEFKRVYKKQKR